MESLTVVKGDLQLAFLEWELEFRSGKCMPPEEVACMTPNEVARANAEHFWTRLLSALPH